MDKKETDDYIVLFKGAKLSKPQANKVGLSLIFGFVGALISVGIIGPGNKLAALVIASVFASIGYFGLGKRGGRP